MVLVLTGAITHVDMAIYDGFMGRGGRAVSIPMIIITQLGSTPFLVIFVVLLVLYFRGKTPARFILVTALASLATNQLLKFLVQRDRPELYLSSSIGSSFPSGHAQTGTAIFIALAVILFTKIKNRRHRNIVVGICLAIPILVSVSRIYLGAHYASDVIAGLLLGILIPFVVFCIFPLDNAKNNVLA